MLPWYTHLGIKFTSHRSAFSVSPSPFFLVFVIMPGTPVTLKRENFGAVDDCLTVVTARGKNDIAGFGKCKEFARLQIAFAHCLRMTLRKQPQAEVLAHYLKTEDLQPVLASNSPANRILLIMGSGWRFSAAMGSFQISCLLASTIGLMIFQRSWQDASALPIRQFLCLHPDFASYRLSVLYHAAVRWSWTCIT